MLCGRKEIYSSEVIKGYNGFILLKPNDKSFPEDSGQGQRCTRAVGADGVESIEKVPQRHGSHQK